MVIVKALAERQQPQQPPISTRFTGTVNCIALLAMFMGLIAYVPVAQETDKDGDGSVSLQNKRPILCKVR
jgi:hypothetical protein